MCAVCGNIWADVSDCSFGKSSTIRRRCLFHFNVKWWYYVDNMLCDESKTPCSISCNWPFFHHYQGSIDFNTVNIYRTVGMYFLVSTGKRGDIEWHDLQRSYYQIHSLLPGVYVSILSLGTVFPRTLPWANIRNTSSRGKHWQCSSNDADKLNVDICRQAKRHSIGCTI